MSDVKKKIEDVFENEVKLVRATCHNILRAPMYGKNLQDTVIFHLRNFKNNLLEALKLDERAQAILEELRSHPEGVGFNQLCNRLKDKMARQTLSERLSKLVKDGLVERTPEKPRRGQRVLYREK